MSKNDDPKIVAIKLSDLFSEAAERIKGKKTGTSGSVEDVLQRALGDSVPRGVQEELARVIRGEEEKPLNRVTSTIESQAELLDYWQQPIPKPGTLVERNKFGETIYAEPEPNESILVVDVWPDYRPEEQVGEGQTKFANGVVAYCNHHGVIRVHAADLRMFKEITPAVKVTAETKH